MTETHGNEQIVDAVVVYVRPSRSKPGMDTVHVAPDDPTGNDGRLFPLHVPADSMSKGDKRNIVITPGSYQRARWA